MAPIGTKPFSTTPSHMKKPSKKTENASAFKLEFDHDGWEAPEVKLIKMTTPKGTDEGVAGWREDKYSSDSIHSEVWSCFVGEEDSCCGFPTLREMNGDA